MSDDVEARYREAIERAREAEELGRPNAAILAYAEAAAAAPDRVAPYVAMGSLHLAAGRGTQAIEAFEAALRRDPRDEDALRGRADALAVEGRPADAAAALDILATTAEAAGRHLDAMVAVRRALEMAESKPRRRVLADLVDAVRTKASKDGVDLDQVGVGELAAAEALLAHDVGEMRVVPPEVTGAVASLAEADRAALAGDSRRALETYLAAGGALANAGLRDAALDTCFAALSIAPGDLELHLMLAEIYARAGWSEHLESKARVVRRFLELEPDEAASTRLASIVSQSPA